MLKEPILRDPKYLHWIKYQPCIVTGYRYVDGADMRVDPAHIRYGFFGKGMKPPDNHVLPLRHDLHLEQHVMGEVAFWLLFNGPDFRAANAKPDEIMRALIAYAEGLYEKWRNR